MCFKNKIIGRNRELVRIFPETSSIKHLSFFSLLTKFVIYSVYGLCLFVQQNDRFGADNKMTSSTAFYF